MPLDAPPPGSPESWLVSARSDYALASASKPAEVLWEALCFHAQQAAEKALKAVMLFKGIRFRHVHDLGELVSGLEKGGVTLPAAVRKAAQLTVYATAMRYPDAGEPVTESECRAAVQIARDVLDWAEGCFRSV